MIHYPSPATHSSPRLSFFFLSSALNIIIIIKWQLNIKLPEAETTSHTQKSKKNIYLFGHHHPFKNEIFIHAKEQRKIIRY